MVVPVISTIRRAARALARAVAAEEYAHELSVGWSPPSKPARRSLPAVLLVLTFATGIVDAVSYLGLGRVFTGLQTGNVVVLGFALAGTPGFSVAPPAVSLAAFFAGAVSGGRLAVTLGRRHRRWFSLALVIEALLVALAGAAAVGVPTDVATGRRLLVVALLALGMGLRSATVRRLDVPELTTTVVTSTITALATDRSGRGPELARRLWRVATLGLRLLGAVAGALLVRETLVLPFLLVAGLIAVAAAVYVAPVVAREHRRRSPNEPPGRG
jgi:uncharacterized membrane protein YoaK (UPF0700 family)